MLNREEDIFIGHTRITHGFLMAREEPPIGVICDLTIKHLMTRGLKPVSKQISETR